MLLFAGQWIVVTAQSILPVCFQAVQTTRRGPICCGMPTGCIQSHEFRTVGFYTAYLCRSHYCGVHGRFTVRLLRLESPAATHRPTNAIAAK